MRIALYTLDTDKRKAETIASMTGDKYQLGKMDGGEGCAVQMSFQKVGKIENYRLDERTKCEIADSVGLLSAVDSVVFIMHAYPGKLCPQGAKCGNVNIASNGAAWDLLELRTLLMAWGASSVYFLCCEFGAHRNRDLGEPFRVHDGPDFASQGLRAGTRIFAMEEKVFINSGMPVLSEGFYTRKLTR